MPLYFEPCIFEACIEYIGLYFPLIFNQVPILDHLCLTIEANEVVAIVSNIFAYLLSSFINRGNKDFVIDSTTCFAKVGLSGSGKSTFVSLLLRLYEPSNGQVC